jgi:hypothetical protein
MSLIGVLSSMTVPPNRVRCSCWWRVLGPGWPAPAIGGDAEPVTVSKPGGGTLLRAWRSLSASPPVLVIRLVTGDPHWWPSSLIRKEDPDGPGQAVGNAWEKEDDEA